IHYQQMEKADRDYSHAKRAEDEYRKVILQYPDSKLVPEAKQRLLEVQEVLADREFGIGRFYYLRQSYPASIPRLQSLVEKYPLYSRADEALYLLGQDYEGQLARIRSAPTCDTHDLPRGCLREETKSRYIGDLTKHASEAYDKILTRYPMMDRSDDAKKRLAALHQPIPRPTKAMVAQNKAELASRNETTMAQKFMGIIKKGPDVAAAAHKGEPTLVDPEPVAATNVVRGEAFAAAGVSAQTPSVEIVKPDQPSAADAAGAAGTDPASASPFWAASGTPNASGPDPNEQNPSPPADPNELKPAADGADPSLPPPVQVSEIAGGQSSSANATADDSAPATDQDLSSSKKKRKKGLKKIVPF